jgi:beta-galactosidase
VLDGLPEGVEAVRRGDLLFVLNHGSDRVTVTVPGHHLDLLTGALTRGTLTLGRYGVAALREDVP